MRSPRIFAERRVWDGREVEALGYSFPPPGEWPRARPAAQYHKSIKKAGPTLAAGGTCGTADLMRMLEAGPGHSAPAPPATTVTTPCAVAQEPLCMTWWDTAPQPTPAAITPWCSECECVCVNILRSQIKMFLFYYYFGLLRQCPTT